MCSEVRRRGGLGGLPTPLVVLSTEGMLSTLLLLPTPCFLLLALQKWQLDFFGLFVSCPEFAPTTHAHSYFLSFIVLLFVCSFVFVVA